MGNPIYVFGAGRGRQAQIIAHHLVLSGYGHWLSNDPRGSGSTELRDEKFEPLGPIHQGRKPIQPPREEIRAFYRQANPLLKYDSLWFDARKREILQIAFAQVVRDFGYTVYACALCSTHTHLVVRRHKDDATTIWTTFAGASAQAMRETGGIEEGHPVWADRPYGVFIKTCDGVRGRVKYVKENPGKEGLAPQSFDFVVPYDNWPYHKGSGARAKR
jgi:REP element-mobilizing transposase RayT